MPDNSNLPVHVGIIMDGNGRWAKRQGLQRSDGHKQGAKTFKKICEYAADIGIEYLTFYAFSTENWNRPPDEVAAIMNLFRDYLHEAEERKEENVKRGFRLRYIGERAGLPEDIIDLIDTAERESSGCKRTIVNLAVNYGGRQEILQSVRSIAYRIAAGEIAPEEITQADIEAGLYTAGQPDPDFIIRPSGEYRLSNFLIWQAAYAEFWYSDILWPDFSPEDFDMAIKDYLKRNRRFGGI